MMESLTDDIYDAAKKIIDEVCISVAICMYIKNHDRIGTSNN